jgi:hypothetical protein
MRDGSRSGSLWRMRYVVCALAGALLATACQQAPIPKADDARPVVTAYLTAMEARDHAALAGLAEPGRRTAGDIQRRLRRYGGVPAEELSMQFRSPFGDRVLFVDITGYPGGAEQHITLSAIQGKWYIALGVMPGADAGNPPRACPHDGPASPFPEKTGSSG